MRTNRRLIGPSGMAGMVALWGASSIVRSVQVTSRAMQGGTTTTQTIAAVDMNNAVVVIHGLVAGADADTMDMLQWNVVLTDATTLTFNRGAGGGGTDTIVVGVIEFAPGVIKSLQRGTITLSSVTSNTATIAAVNTAKSIIMAGGYTTTRGNAEMRSNWTYLDLTNSTTVTAARNFGTGTCLAAYQVVEFF